MPDATVKYYLSKSDLNITVNQTVRCIDTSNPVVVTNVGFDAAYSADLNNRKEISFSELDTIYTSGSADITLSKDGRIEAFNSSSTGVVSDVIATVISMFGSLKTLDIDPLANQVESACEIINNVAGQKDGKPLPLSIVLKSSVKFLEGNKVTGAPFKITGYPQSFYSAIAPAVGKLEYIIDTSEQEPEAPVETTYKGKRKIALIEPALVPVKVTLKSYVSNESTEYSANIPVPQWGTEYNIPIPKPPMFGTNTLNLSLHETGKIKTLKYGTTNGSKDLGSAFNTLSDKLVETDLEKAASIKAEADVIAQQQRLIGCKTTPEECK